MWDFWWYVTRGSKRPSGRWIPPPRLIDNCGDSCVFAGKIAGSATCTRSALENGLDSVLSVAGVLQPGRVTPQGTKKSLLLQPVCCVHREPGKNSQQCATTVIGILVTEFLMEGNPASWWNKNFKNNLSVVVTFTWDIQRNRAAEKQTAESI